MDDADYRQAQHDRVTRLQEHSAGLAADNRKQNEELVLLRAQRARAVEAAGGLKDALDRLASIARLRAEQVEAQMDVIAGLRDDLASARAAAERSRQLAEAEGLRAASLQARLEVTRRLAARAPEPPAPRPPDWRRIKNCTCDLCTRGPA